MFIETKQVTQKHTRVSKLNRSHEYTRNKTVAVFKCDNCQTTFERDVGLMDRKRLNNRYFHVCGNCNQKQFAQKRGVERRTIWDISVDRDIDISRY